jgi:uncharacterized membrane protein YedE/YeeE
MNQVSVAFGVGFLFSIGLGISGMTQPQKVIGFLDLANWNPSLMFVMVGAIGVHAVFYRLVRKRASPLLEKNWYIPETREITSQLLLGAAVFGVGWGVSGYCPGPAVTAMASGDLRPWVFVGSMALGMFIYQKVERSLFPAATDG